MKKQEAVELISKMYISANTKDKRMQLRQALEIAIESLKAEPKHGKWETCKSGRYAVCTNCRMYWIPIEDKYDYWFCPRCGADMREVEE